ncbi:hypothetical protein C8R44DRAFT_820838 [Mycena epipterygia]|nr:hypothetical protein C8R44DRAFT_820838 [Mycena epipterygia]
MGSILSTHPREASIPESAPPKLPEQPDIIFNAPYFWPEPLNVLVNSSFSTMGGPGLACALLYSPHVSPGGIAVDGQGRLSTVPADRWEEMEEVVHRAKEVWAEPDGRSSWSRPQMGSCPVDCYYDLGPAETVDGLCVIQRTGHTVSTEDLVVSVGERSISLPVMKHPEILTYKKTADGTYEREEVKEIPKPITTLESALHKLCAELFLSSPGDPLPEGVEVKAMLKAIKEMSSAERTQLRLREMVRDHWKKRNRSRWW